MNAGPMQRIIFLTVIAFFAMGSQGWTEPMSIPNLTAPEVKGMLDGGKTVVVHTLSSIEYQIQHITGSINIPIINMKTSEKLPTDPSTPVVFYCMGFR